MTYLRLKTCEVRGVLVKVQTSGLYSSVLPAFSCEGQEGPHLLLPLSGSPSLLTPQHNGPIKCFRPSHMNTDYTDPALCVASRNPEELSPLFSCLFCSSFSSLCLSSLKEMYFKKKSTERESDEGWTGSSYSLRGNKAGGGVRWLVPPSICLLFLSPGGGYLWKDGSQSSLGTLSAYYQHWPCHPIFLKVQQPLVVLLF